MLLFTSSAVNENRKGLKGREGDLVGILEVMLSNIEYRLHEFFFL